MKYLEGASLDKLLNELQKNKNKLKDTDESLRNLIFHLSAEDFDKASSEDASGKDEKDSSASLSSSPLPMGMFLRLSISISEALQYAHERGVIHRDLKPSNVMVDKEGDAVLLDFGLARQLGEGKDLTTTGQVMGSISYMSPEQAAGVTEEVDEQSDIFVMGAVVV